MYYKDKKLSAKRGNKACLFSHQTALLFATFNVLKEKEICNTKEKRKTKRSRKQKKEIKRDDTE